MFFVPEAKSRDKKHTVGMISIQYFNNFFLMGRSEAEGILPINNTHYYIAKYSKSIKCSNYALAVFCARGAAEGLKTIKVNSMRLILVLYSRRAGYHEDVFMLCYAQEIVKKKFDNTYVIVQYTKSRYKHLKNYLYS